MIISVVRRFYDTRVYEIFAKTGNLLSVICAVYLFRSQRRSANWRLASWPDFRR
ncbi:hypothetical protein O9993_03205 [Vibrio lentus]|nr:hypothetical protein [Vibrio lentus]